MNNIFIHFCANFPLILFVNEKKLGTLENQTDTLSIEVNCEQNFIVGVIPILNENFENSIPFLSQIFVSNKNVISTCDQIEITKYDDFHFEILLKPLTLTTTPKNVLKSFHLNEHLLVEMVQNFNCELEITFKNKVFKYKLPEKLIDTKCEFFEEDSTHFLIFEGKNIKNQYFLLVFNDFFCNLEIVCDVLERSKNEIKALIYLNDIAKHGLVKKYILKEKKYVLEEEFLVYLDDEPKITQKKELIPLSFCEALNVEDLTLARTFLSDDLNKLLSDEHLKTFFGNYEEIKWNRHKKLKNNLCFIYDGNPKLVKNFCFELKNNKITNITEIK